MKSKKPMTRMTTEELAAATKHLESLTFDQTRPLNSQTRRWWERVRRNQGTGNGSRSVLIKVDGGLLERADRLAERNGLTRSQLFAHGLQAVLGATLGRGAGKPRAGRVGTRGGSVSRSS